MLKMKTPFTTTNTSSLFSWTFVCELAVTSLFAIVLSFIASRIVHRVLNKPAPEKHAFNHTETFLASYLTAMTLFILIKIVDWRTAFQSHLHRI